MPSVTRKPRAQPVADRRPAIEARLLEATERLLEDGSGFTELSVEQLCSEAGIARSTFYVYFRDKGDLLVRLAEEMLDHLATAAAAWWTADSSRKELLEATRAMVGIYARHTALFAAFTETAAYDAELRAIQEQMLDHHGEPLARLIDAGKRDGTVRDVHTQETVTALMWMVQGACHRLTPGADGAGLDRLAETIAAISWHALYRDERRGL